MKTLKGYAILAALAVPGFALAASETESNHPIGLAQTVTITADAGQATGGAVLDGVIGNLSGAAVLDLDFFSFSGKEGDVVTLDIDMGMGGARNVDTILAVFGPAPTHTVLRFNDDGGMPLDSGSIHAFDARITNFRLATTGTYVVGVSSYPRRFVNGGITSSATTAGANANGDYTLVISGVTPALLQISIDIKPGNDAITRINPRSKGKIPVALLGAADFTVTDVDQDTLTFGHTGDEASLAKCPGEPTDVNGDVWPDMICHFENQDAKFDPSDDEAILRGELNDGRKFEGRGWLKVKAVKVR